MTAMARGIHLAGTAPASHGAVMRSRSASPPRQGQARPARGTAARGAPAGTTQPSATVTGTQAISGPGCAATGTAETGQGGDGWIDIPGGAPACGGKALTTRTTGTMGLVQDTYTWSFRIGHPASCAVQIFVPDANPSSGIAHYDVYPATIAPASKITGFDVIQRSHRGQWFGVGSFTTPDGVLRIQLIDQPAYPGGTYHVTASAVGVSCG